MFDVGFFEVIIVLVVLVFVSDYEKFPEAISGVKKYYRGFLNLKSSLLKDLDGIASGINAVDIVEKNIIRGDDGKVYEAYDVGNEEEKKKYNVEVNALPTEEDHVHIENANDTPDDNTDNKLPNDV